MQVNKMNNQPSFGMASKVLKSVRKFDPDAFFDCKSLIIRELGNEVDVTFFKKTNKPRLYCEATPKNIFNANNSITRFYYGLRGRSKAAWVGVGSYNGEDSIKKIVRMATGRLKSTLNG